MAAHGFLVKCASVNSDEDNQPKPQSVKHGSTDLFRMALLLGALAIMAGVLLRMLAHRFW